MKIKKNDKAYLLDLKIDIRTDRDDHYQELALLFDKPTYLNLLLKLRKEYKVVNFLSVDEYRGYDIGDFGDDFIAINLSKYTKIKSFKKDFSDYYDDLKEKSDLPFVLENECYLICYEYNRPPYFYNVIRQSIFCGVVTDENFQPTKAEIIEPNAMWFGATLPPIAIFVSPTSTYEDVKEEFRKAKELMKTDKRLSYYKPRLDFVNNIRQYRLWYWQRIEGKTYQKIADDYVKSMLPKIYNTTYQDVIKGVKIYEKLLAS